MIHPKLYSCGLGRAEVSSGGKLESIGLISSNTYLKLHPGFSAT